MCMTVSASEMSSTKIYAGEAKRNGTYVHVLSYQNNAESLHPGPNAMILPIPAKAPMGPENAIDTRSFKGFLNSIADSTKAPNRSRSLGKSAPAGVAGVAAVSIFDIGSYSVFLSSSLGAGAKAVQSLPVEKRPKLNAGVLSTISYLYPNWSFAICCWDGSVKAEPMLWWYEPMRPEVLFAPGLDAHDGGPPKKSRVWVDHIVTFGSTLKPTGYRPIRYKDVIPSSAQELLPIRAVGQSLQGYAANGDFLFRTSDLVGEVAMDGEIPPGFRAWPGTTDESLRTGEPFEIGTWD